MWSFRIEWETFRRREFWTLSKQAQVPIVEQPEVHVQFGDFVFHKEHGVAENTSNENVVSLCVQCGIHIGVQNARSCP